MGAAAERRQTGPGTRRRHGLLLSTRRGYSGYPRSRRFRWAADAFEQVGPVIRTGGQAGRCGRGRGERGADRARAREDGGGTRLVPAHSGLGDSAPGPADSADGAQDIARRAADSVGGARIRLPVPGGHALRRISSAAGFGLRVGRPQNAGRAGTRSRAAGANSRPTTPSAASARWSPTSTTARSPARMCG